MEGLFLVGERIGRTKKGSKAFVRTKVPGRRTSTLTTAASLTKTNETPKSSGAEKAPSPPPASSPIVAADPATATAPVPADPADATALNSAGPAAVTAPVAADPAIATAPVSSDSAIAAASASSEWTEAEDTTLCDMKQKNKSWKDIEDALPGKNDRDVLKQRYRELMAAKAKEKGGTEPSKAEEKKNESGSEKGSKKGKEETGKGEIIKSNLKEGSQRKDDGEVKQLGDRPVIYIETGDQLDAGQLATLYKLHAKAEKGKWIEISSRFFDKTGQRIEPDVLRDKLGNC